MVLEETDKTEMAESGDVKDAKVEPEGEQAPPTISVDEPTPSPEVEAPAKPEEEPPVEEESPNAMKDEKPEDAVTEDAEPAKDEAADPGIEKVAEPAAAVAAEAEAVAGTDDEATHTLLGDGDVESAKKNGGENLASEEEKTSLKTRLVRQLSRREVLVCLVGGVMFLAGLILILVAVISMQSGCTYVEPENEFTDASPDGVQVGLLDEEDKPSDGTGSTHFDDVIKYYNDTNSNNTNVVVPQVNLALGRPAFLSTTAIASDGNPDSHQAELAVDGEYKTNMDSSKCAQTAYEDKPHFELDLVDEHTIRQVVLQSGSSCCGGELHNFVIGVREQPDSDDVICREYLGTALPYTLTLNCTQPIKGRYLRVTVLGDESRPKNRLTLCEVKVYGD